ncbi:hypothetical protein GCM10023189_13550 [Nibrella saemangeumensis]|uniref:Uncharacterized protein n=1 Tax=Nibrella saemangeumensis TaxID=1084526 RepID=A0ABP8MJW9_9BACT
MKSLRLAMVGLLCIALAGTVLAQEETKLRRDVTYSTRNYKHPNKAAVARQWEPEASVSFRKRGNRRVTIGDYKRTTTSRDARMARMGLSAPTVPVAERNYKAQNFRRKATAREKEQPVVNMEQQVVVEPSGN